MSETGSLPSGVTVTLSASAASALPASGPFVSGTYQTTDYSDTSPGGDAFPGPAPAGPYPTALSAFNGTDANGTWLLYVFDDGPGDQGSFGGGWSLTITTTGPGTPTISNILDQSTAVNTPTSAIPFTVADADTPVGDLTLSGSSDNEALVPNGNIVFGGSGANRTVTVTPNADQTGSATITVTVSDGANTASDTFVLTVVATNTPPTISNISDQTINQDTSTGAIAVTVGDAETAPGSLTVSGSSDNTTLVPNGNIVFGGSGANRTVTVTPAANQTGSATITVTVSDGANTASDTFVLTVVAANTPPTISNISDQTINQNTSTGAIAFTVGDAETAPGSLTVSGSSDNTTLVPNGNIVFGGSGANRTVTVTPAANQTGSATITVTVSDGANTASDSFVLTVIAPNTPPTISNISNQTINEDTSTSAIAFIVGDAETAPGSLTVSGSSDNTTLVPNGNIVFGGSGANRTVTVAPAANQNGTATITVSVSDGLANASDTFVLTVNAVNDAPTISDIANLTISRNGTTGPLSFTVGDVETPAGSLTMSGSSNNTTLVPNGNIVFGGSGANRTVTVTPATGQTGTATITVTVSDGQLSASDTFVLTVVTNLPPTIQPIANQTAYIDQPVIIKLELADAETPVTDLQLSLVTDNPTLIKPEDYEFHYFFFDQHRYLTIAGAFGQVGSATNTVTVSDGVNSASTSFVMTVLPPPSGAARFANTSPMTIPDVGAASLVSIGHQCCRNERDDHKIRADGEPVHA